MSLKTGITAGQAYVTIWSLDRIAKVCYTVDSQLSLGVASTCARTPAYPIQPCTRGKSNAKIQSNLPRVPNRARRLQTLSPPVRANQTPRGVPQQSGQSRWQDSRLCRLQQRSGQTAHHRSESTIRPQREKADL